MKKLILVLGMIACMTGLMACGVTAKEAETFGMTEVMAVSLAEGVVAEMNSIVTSGGKEQFENDPVIYNALASWEAALTEIGEFQSVDGHEITYNNDGVIVLVNVSGTKKEAQVEIVLDEDLMYTSITTNVVYTMGELMAKAAMNTLLGMGTVFAVLILISVIIAALGLIPRLLRSKEEEPAKKAPAPTAPTAPAPVVQAAAQPAGCAVSGNDLELIAVIAAAVAASEGAASSNGYVVRSIRRRNR